MWIHQTAPAPEACNKGVSVSQITSLVVDATTFSGLEIAFSATSTIEDLGVFLPSYPNEGSNFFTYALNPFLSFRSSSASQEIDTTTTFEMVGSNITGITDDDDTAYYLSSILDSEHLNSNFV